MDAVMPDYGGAWVGGVVPALLGDDRPAWLPAAARDAPRTVLLVLDGLGWEIVERDRALLPSLSGMAGGRITTVVPTTTAAALTAITTGRPPAVHGLVGYRIRVGGTLLNVLSWTASGDRGATLPEPESVQQVTPFLGQHVPVVTRAEFADSGFTRAHLRGGTLDGWDTTTDLVERVVANVRAGAPLTYAYLDDVDRVGHASGLHDERFAAALAAADGVVGTLLEALPADTALVVTADHGQVHVDRDGLVELEPLLGHVAAVAGEGRFRSLHARTGSAQRLHEEALTRFGEVAWVFRRDELFDAGWLGDGAGPTIRGRIGDVVLAARDAWSFVDPGDRGEARILGRHGSLTRAEVEVPLLAARGRAAGLSG